MIRNIRINFVVAVFFATGSLFAQLAYADLPTAKIRCSIGNKGATVVVTTEGEIQGRVSSLASEGVIRFDRGFRPVAESPLDKCGWMIKGVQLGFNTVLVSAAKGSTVQALKSGRTYTIQITPGPELSPEQGTEDRNLMLARARVLFEEGQRAEALILLQQAIEKYPNDAETLYTLGNYESSSGQYRSALRHLNAWAKIRPDLAAGDPLLNELAMPYWKTLGGGFEYYDGGDSFKERLYRLGFRAPIGIGLPTTMLGFQAETNDASFDDLRNPGGVVQDYSFDRQRYQVQVAHPFVDDEVRVTVRGAEYATGGGVDYEQVDTSGHTNLGVHVNEPDWEYASSLAFKGARDSVAISRDQSLADRFLGQLGLGVNRYSLKGASDAATSMRLSGRLDYVLVKDLPYVALSYRLFGDYFVDRDERGEGAARYHPFTAQSNEFHTVTLGVSQRVGAQTLKATRASIFAFGGYAANRLGEGAPEVGAGVRAGGLSGVDFKVEVGRSFSTVSDADAQTRIIVGLELGL